MMQDLFLQVTGVVHSFINVLKNISWQEWFGVVFSMVQVVLARYNNAINYLFGIAGILLTLYVMYVSGLYAEFGLNLYYLVMSIYGWIHWMYGKQNKEIPISKSSQSDWGKVIAIVVLSFFICVWALIQFTNSVVPFYDAAISAFAWAGMWLMAKRKLENWVLLNISNLVAIPLYIYKEIYLYAFLSGFLFVIAVKGYFHWKEIMNKELVEESLSGHK